MPRHILALAACIAVAAPAWAAMQGESAPYEQDFVITAYYSPLPDQCCYVKGSEIADKVLNGQGRAGADGTPVYPGMAAAPGTYAFGTRIQLPGIGVVTVHDRGGAIQEKSEGHRLDLWAGYGEEGLARALPFGVKRVRGTVYPRGSRQPAESVDLAALTAPYDRLRPFLVLDYGMLDVQAKTGDTGLSVALLQEHLKDLGYFDHAVTGKFGAVTQQSLEAFYRDMELKEPSVALTQRGAAYLVAAHRRKEARIPLVVLGPENSGSRVAAAQRILRLVGKYDGRTDGQYSPALRDAIIAFQKEHSLVGGPESPGAGRIGPKTRGVLEELWKRLLIARQAERYLLLHRTVALLGKQGKLVEGFLAEGKTGDDVRLYQRMLSEQGYFPADKINGVFGPLTREATIKYQLAQGLIKKVSDKGAGTVGSLTLRQLRLTQIAKAYRLVRSFGLQAL